MKAIAARDKIALQLDLLLLVDKADTRLGRIYIRHLDIFYVEKDLLILCEARGNQILQDFVLRIHRDGAPVGQFRQGDAMTLSIKAELDTVMNDSFALHAFPKTHFRQQLDRALLEHTGA